MRLAVSARGYQDAARALVSGNRIAAEVCVELSAALQAHGGMAGDDATATEFAAAYDEAAAASLATLGELVEGLASLAHLAEASLANHDRAERDSVLPGWAVAVTGPPSVADRAVGVRPAAPPSSLGGDPQVLPEAVNWILDRIEGVVWPDADTDRLREAAATWRRAGGGVRRVLAGCDAALAAFEQEESPEIPLAVATTLDLRERVLDLADQLDALGGSCAAYADQVDAHRRQMLDLLTDLAIELGVGAIVSGVLTLLSGGLAAVAASSAAAARIAWAARRLQLIVDALRVLNGGTAARVRPLSTTLRDARTWLTRLHASRMAARTERGSFRLLPGDDPWPRGFLSKHEHSGSHTLRDHMGREDSALRNDIATGVKREFSSSFPDQETAERAVSVLLRRERAKIQDWLAQGRGRLRLDGHMDFNTGRTADTTGSVYEVRGVRAILVSDSTMPNGYRILTSFPQP